MRSFSSRSPMGPLGIAQNLRRRLRPSGSESQERRRRFQPRVEILEERTVPSITILNGGGLGYAGISDGSDPPDTCGAAGPSSYIEAINGTVAIYTPKATGANLTSMGIFNFFYNNGTGLTRIDAGSGGTNDSTIIFDNLMGANGRFLVGDIDVDQTTNVSQYVFAISTSNNPATLTTADWNFYHITTTEGSGMNTTWGDYPGNPGFNKDAVVETFNMAKGNKLTGNAQVLSINASDLANGVAQASLHFYHNDITGSFSYRPTTMHDSVAGDPMWLIHSPNTTSVDVVKMTNVLSNAAGFATTNLGLPAAYDFQSLSISPKNPDGSTINDIDSRILKAGEYNNTIVATQKVQVSGNELDAQWYAINVSGAPTFQLVGGVANVGRVGFGANTYSFDPGIDINSTGQIGLSFNESDTLGGAAGKTTGGFVSTFVTARTPSETAGTMETSDLVTAGIGTGNINDRSGDFSGMNIDPVNGSFWAINELGNNGSGATVIANFTPSAPPTVTPPATQTVAEGAFSSLKLGSFADPSGGPWSVDVNWGDGSTDTTFSVTTPGTIPAQFHTYQEEGHYTLTVTVTDALSLSGSASSLVTVSDPVVVATGSAAIFAATEGSPSLMQTVATFTDPGGSEPVTDYQAVISWGDTTTSFGIISGPVAGVYTVSARHTYVEEGAGAAGTYNINVTINHDDAGPSNTVTTTANVNDPAVVATAGPAITNAVEGKQLVNVPVATFVDPAGAEPNAFDPTAIATHYSATIQWGDGGSTTTGPNDITFNGVYFTVLGTYTYGEESGANPYTISVTVHHENAQVSNSVTTTATVSDPAVVATGGFAFAATEGLLSAIQTVATFTDPGGAEPNPADPTGIHYTATITWGDGTNSAGQISGPVAGVFTVSGAHTYGEEGTYTIQVVVHHENAPDSNVVSSTANVGDPPVAGTTSPVFGVACSVPATYLVATFTDPGGAEPNDFDPAGGIANHYSASINWGDLTAPSAGTITFNAGVFSINGMHAYLNDGTYTITTTINHEASVPPTVVLSTATIKDDLGVLLLDPKGSMALRVTGTSSLTANNCGAIVVNSNNATQAVYLSQEGKITAYALDVNGGILQQDFSTINANIEGEPPTADPLGLALPAAPAPTHGAVHYLGITPLTLSPGTYVGGISLGGSGAVTLLPGVYYMKGGGFRINGVGSVTGNGVVIINAPAGPNDVISITRLSTATGAVSLSAPSSGPFQGISLFQDPNSSNPVNLVGPGNVTLTGVVYVPHAAVSLTNSLSLTINPSAGTVTLPPILGALISYDLSVDGGAHMTVNPDVHGGGATAGSNVPSSILGEALPGPQLFVSGGNSQGSGSVPASAVRPTVPPQAALDQWFSRNWSDTTAVAFGASRLESTPAGWLDTLSGALVDTLVSSR